MNYFSGLRLVACVCAAAGLFSLDSFGASEPVAGSIEIHDVKDGTSILNLLPTSTAAESSEAAALEKEAVSVSLPTLTAQRQSVTNAEHCELHSGGEDQGKQESIAVVERISAPENFMVAQRSGGIGTFSVATLLGTQADCVEARLLRQGAVVVAWAKLQSGALAKGSLVSSKLVAPEGGWYRLEVRAVSKGLPGPVKVIDSVGVGDVYVTAGQSNSTFHGDTPQTTATGSVSYFDGQRWMICADPLDVGDTGKGGGVWCPLGDLLSSHENVPIAFSPVGFGGSSIKQWQPGEASPLGTGGLFKRLEERVRMLRESTGLKAILWHQGEADTLAGTSEVDYGHMLSVLISNIFHGVGAKNVPWYVSQASLVNGKISSDVLRGQRATIFEDSILGGAETDRFREDLRDPAGVHFTHRGLHRVAAEWFYRITSSSTFGAGKYTLRRGDISPVGSSKAEAGLTLGEDGNLVLFAKGKPLWNSGPHAAKCKTDSCQVIFQADGNLVVYGDDLKPIWHSGTYGRPNSELTASIEAPYLRIIDAEGKVAWEK